MDVIQKLAIKQIGSCTCLTKAPEPEFHKEDCNYRVLIEAELEITRWRQRAEELEQIQNQIMLMPYAKQMMKLEDTIAQLRKGQGEPVGAVVDCDFRGSPIIRWDVVPTFGDKLYTSAPAIPDGYQLVPVDIHPLDTSKDCKELIELLRNPPSAIGFTDELNYYSHWWSLLLAASPKQKEIE